MLYPVHPLLPHYSLNPAANCSQGHITEGDLLAYAASRVLPHAHIPVQGSGLQTPLP